MRTVFTLAIVTALISGTLNAQRMGHSNTNAPQVTQSIDLAGKATMKLSYASITWASGTWAKALADKTKRDKIRDRINAAAEEGPLGTLETDVAVMIGQQRVPGGRYDLSFGLDTGFQWQIRLRGPASVAIPLNLTKRSNVRRRLTLNVNAGDDDFTAALDVGFGDKGCEIAIAPHADDSPAKSTTKKKTRKKPVAATKIINRKCPLMDEDADPEISVVYKGHTIGLCCDDCIEDWNKLSVPKKEGHLATMLATRGGKRGKDTPSIWTCPMHPEIKQAKPGDCPKCHMDLVPQKKRRANTKQAR